MSIKKRKVSLHDIVWLSIPTYKDWEIWIVGDDHSLTVPRILLRPILKAMSMPITTFRRFMLDNRLSLFERWGYSLEDDRQLIFIINYSNHLVLGVRRYRETKSAETVKKESKGKSKGKGVVKVNHPELYVYRYTLGVVLALVVFILYFFLYPK